MLGVKRFVLVLIVLVAALSVLIFALENQRNVVVSFLGWTTVQLPVSVFIIGALVVGLCIGPALALIFQLRTVKR
ncbi:lipopolysaccharide assembly protein LapA domain-containing protein [Pseudomonas marginalis]|uniref:lipopolysaccharide assembly protein LapA domain-containing protein n=1 Tax=Pseudomonas marginalis TaxID=298 RepID=UPI00203404BB|nr:lipopolysaccharide assembly protein LapA domain-containing protein [Pseudomonas marginalis]MCM2379530.1 lipopolysaccharide assembly protein LapA domain-containing protein [Pseudomonas marginalis]